MTKERTMNDNRDDFADCQLMANRTDNPAYIVGTNRRTRRVVPAAHFTPKDGLQIYWACWPTGWKYDDRM